MVRGLAFGHKSICWRFISLDGRPRLGQLLPAIPIRTQVVLGDVLDCPEPFQLSAGTHHCCFAIGSHTSPAGGRTYRLWSRPEPASGARSTAAKRRIATDFLRALIATMPTPSAPCFLLGVGRFRALTKHIVDVDYSIALCLQIFPPEKIPIDKSLARCI